jgi:hypothetical protein
VLLPAAILAALSPGRILSSTLDNPLGIEALPNDSKAIEAFMYALIVVGASSMLGRLRHAGTIERQQIKWFAYATAVAISGVILKNSVYPAVGVTWVWWVGLVLTTVGVVSSPVVMGIAILRYRLYQIDILINRTLVYGSLTAVLAGVYLGGVVLLQYAFRTLTGEGSQLAVVASTLIIATLFIPPKKAHPVLHRQTLLQKEVRREEDPGSLLGQAAQPNRSGGIERRPGRGGKGDDAAGPRLLVAATRDGSEGQQAE